MWRQFDFLDYACVEADLALKVTRMIGLRGTKVADPSTAGVFPHPDGVTWSPIGR